MEFFEVVKKRSSYRGAFKDRKVPRKDLKRIVQAGLKAPSGKNAQTTSFIIIDNKDILKKIGSMHVMRAMQDARAMIVCIIDKEPEAVYEGFSFEIEDCSAAVENILLAATALGYASVWIDGWLRLSERRAEIGRLLKLPENKVVRVILPIGIPTEKYHKKQKKKFSERAWFNGYKPNS